MTVLRRPRHPLVDSAMADARRWFAGHMIDSRPAFVHAVRVAVVLGEHVPDPDPGLIAGALLHDSPEFAPSWIDLERLLINRYGMLTRDVVVGLQVEHRALDGPHPIVLIGDPEVLLASTADKIVALSSVTRRAWASGDPIGFLTARPALLRLVPHFRDFRRAATGRVPVSMTDLLERVLSELVATTLGYPRAMCGRSR